jgi:hypothetical protein
MIRTGALWLLFAGASLAAAADPAAFFTGCWSMTAADGSVIEEMWTKPSGGTMHGIGRTVKAGKTVFNEYLEIREEKGVLTYFAQLRLGGPVTPFPLSRASETELVFSNPEHDYPTTIIYRKQPDGGLFARVEGRRSGKLAGEEFPYRRVNCD